MFEISYGIIPLKKRNKKWYVLLVQHGSGHWSFPKGHPEESETPQEAAIRELKEETGLEIAEFIDKRTFKEHYFFTSGSKKVSKTVVYYLAKVRGKVLLQKGEISASLWLPLEKAVEKVTFPEAKRLCREVNELLTCN